MMHCMSVRRLALLGTILGGSLLVASGVHAQTAPAAAPDTAAPAADATTAAPAAPAAPVYGIPIIGPFKLFLQAEGGIGFTTGATSPGNLNFGHLFDDYANGAQLNQVQVGIGKDIDPKATDFDWGTKLLFMYGSDARYTHFLGELTKVTGNSRYQVDVLEADVSLHLPVLTDGGIDVKLGQYPTPVGYEVIDPKGNPFYSHSYIFNFGLPLKHTGGYATIHATDVLDIWGGVDTGVNTSIGKAGNPNGGTSFIGGIGLNMLGGNLTFLALSHFGPANPPSNLGVPISNVTGIYRYLNDAYLTWKATDALTFVTEVNWVHDEHYLGGGAADSYGAAQYVSYTLSDTVTANFRAEIYRDQNAAFVAAFPGTTDFVNSEIGMPNGSFNYGAATYSEFTAGVTIAPTIAPLNTVMFRPEVRYDRSLSSANPYGSGRDKGALTFAADIVLGF